MKNNTQPDETTVNEAHRLADKCGAKVDGTDEAPILIFKRNYQILEYDLQTSVVTGGIGIHKDAVLRAIRDEKPIVWPGTAANDNMPNVVEQLIRLQDRLGGELIGNGEYKALHGAVYEGKTGEVLIIGGIAMLKRRNKVDIVRPQHKVYF